MCLALFYEWVNFRRKCFGQNSFFSLKFIKNDFSASFGRMMFWSKFILAYIKFSAKWLIPYFMLYTIFDNRTHYMMWWVYIHFELMIVVYMNGHTNTYSYVYLCIWYWLNITQSHSETNFFFQVAIFKYECVPESIERGCADVCTHICTFSVFECEYLVLGILYFCMLT